MAISRASLETTDFDDIAEPGSLEPVTPGEILREEFMAPLQLSARALARELAVAPNRITEILNGDRAITAETALLLAKRFNVSPRLWMNLQMSYDLEIARRKLSRAA